MSAPARRAACSCGGLVATCVGEPARVSICHCLACQRRTGSAFGVQARWPTDQVTMSGPESTWTREGDSGGRATYRFCPTCGATVAWEIDRMPGFVAVAVGAFADPAFPAPTVTIYEARRHPWAALGELDAERHE